MKSKILITLFAVAVVVSFAFIGINKTSKNEVVKNHQPMQQKPMSGFVLEDNNF